MSRIKTHYNETEYRLAIEEKVPRLSGWTLLRIDVVLDTLGVNKALPQSTERWFGVVELAEEMGYPQAKELSHRSALGRYVSAKSNGELQRVQEKRLCNGTQRPCWLYLDCERLRQLITTYFAA